MGVGETLRVNGRADIVTEPDLCASFTAGGKPARSVLAVTAERVYVQCPKALVCARLWSVAAQSPGSRPSAGQSLEALSEDGIDGGDYDRAYPEHLKAAIY